MTTKMQSSKIPLIVLGGSDSKSSELPEKGRDQRPLSGFKAADFRPAGGRPLVEVVLERVVASGAFDPVFVAGPVEVYRDIVGEETLIDTNGTLGQNIRNSLEEVSSRIPGSPVAFITCDVVPEVAGLQRLMEDFWRSVPCDLWFPVVRAPKEEKPLGASTWKPRYRLRPTPDEPSVEVLPGHLLIVDPEAVRLALAYELFELAYATRNRPIGYRRNVIMGRLLPKLLYQDLLHILAFRLPTLTLSLVWAGVSMANELRKGRVTRERMEYLLRVLGIKYRHRKRYPERRLLLPITDELSLALDIDTEEEARAFEGRLES